jgi:uncharacterized protein (TIGR02271 family)
MIDQSSVPSLMGSTVRDSAGDRVGKVGQVYLDDTTGLPEWVTVRTGLFGTRESFVPLAAARVEGDELVIDVTKDRVKDAPQIDEDGHLSEEQEAELYRYYGVSPGAFGQDTGPTDGYAAAGTGSYGTTGYATTDATTGYAADATTDTSYAQPAAPYAATGRDADAGADFGADRGADLGADRGADHAGTTDDAMTRSEERLSAGTEQVEAGRARLRKYVVTDTEQVEVPVSREEVRLEREPITESNRPAAESGPAITESEHEVTLHAERPVVQTEAVPVERVRLDKETVTDTETVSGEVRKERVELDDETGTARDR